MMEPPAAQTVVPGAGTPRKGMIMTKANDSKSGATTKQAGGTKGVQNGEPNASFSGLDAQGNMRIGERYSISVRGDKLVILQSHSGREVEVSEDTLAGLIEQEYFVDQK